MGNRGELLLSQYTGSKSLINLSTLTSLSIDQINFIACQFGALIAASILKKYIKDPPTRLVFCMISGLFVCNFCFGVQILHVILPAGLSYFVLCKCKSNYMPWYVFAVSMTYLSWVHIQRQFFELAPGYAIDITGPLMVLTQKVTSLAFAVNDGRKQTANKKISELEKVCAISAVPEPLEYWSYIFQFQSILAGPFVFFHEYREFIYFDQSPSSAVVVLKKLGGSIFFALMYLKFAPGYKIEHMQGEEYLERTSFLNKLIFIYMATTLERTKYYHAWILSDAVCNASGLGYNKETNEWDLATNVDALGFEKGSNLKESLDQWNKGTMRWLRYVVYERCSPSVKTLATYAASAFWHGFFPGYYMTFFSGALFTFTARIVRKTVRPHFMKNAVAKCTYDFITWFTTRIVVSYCAFTFILLDFIPSVKVYMGTYFVFHIAAVSALVVLPRVTRMNAAPAVPNDKSSPNSNGVKKAKSVPNNDNLSPNSNGVKKTKSVPNNNEELLTETFLIHSNSNGKNKNGDGLNEPTKLKTG